MLSPADPLLPETTNLSRRSLIALELLIAVVVVSLFARAGVIALDIDRYRNQAASNHLRTYITRALRGVIYDADGTQLIENLGRDRVAIIPADVPKDPLERARTIAALKDIAGVEPSEVERLLLQYQYIYSPVTLSVDLSPEQKIDLLVRFPDDANGITIVHDFSRSYLDPSNAFSHLLGYVSRITSEEYPSLRDRYRPSDLIGKTGLEATMEDALRGDDGERRISVDAQGRKVATLATSPATGGCDLVLNVRADIQSGVQKILQRQMRASGTSAGVVVAIDPRNGAIRALVSLPTYDNNLFSDGVRGDREVAEFQKLTNDPNRPFLNRAVGGVYPPGSTFKIVTAATVLAENAISAQERVNSPGTITVVAELDPSLRYVYKDWKAEGHGAITIIEAIAESSDTFFYQVVGGFDDRRGMGVLPLASGAERFGFGTPLGIDLVGESGGTVPTPAWKNKVFTVDRKWFQGDTYNFAIGQGYLLATPLQVAASTMVVANGGTLYQPQIVREYRNCDENRVILPSDVRRNVAPEEDLALVRTGMRRAVTSVNGTAKAMQNAPVTVAGKTGTAQYQNNEKEHAWFTLFAPYDQPEIVVTVLVEGGGEGSKTAIPVALDVLRLLYPSED